MGFCRFKFADGPAHRLSLSACPASLPVMRAQFHGRGVWATGKAVQPIGQILPALRRYASKVA